MGAPIPLRRDSLGLLCFPKFSRERPENSKLKTGLLKWPLTARMCGEPLEESITMCGVQRSGSLNRMKRAPKQPLPEDHALVADSDAVV